MMSIIDIHREAMQLADEAFLARLHNEPGRASSLLREAFDKEREAASLVANDLGMEPTRSVLLRSAASLAIDCGETREAERLIGRALSGDPPEEIANELRDLLEQASFHRHLALRGITLEPNEFQVSLAGASVGLGFARSVEFVGRVERTEKLLCRTIDRKLKRPFSESPRKKADFGKGYELYVSVPRAASFAVSFRFGSGEQLRLPGMDLVSEVVDETLACLDLWVQGDDLSLRGRIQDDSYYRNFVALSRSIAPDGENISVVGFTAIQKGQERHVLLSTPRSKLPRPQVPAIQEAPPSRVEISGTLKVANALSERSSHIEIVDKKEQRHRVRVPLGMMADIVRPMFESEVVVVGHKEKKCIVLEDIFPPQ
jgi:hypothetical protein